MRINKRRLRSGKAVHCGRELAAQAKGAEADSNAVI